MPFDGQVLWWEYLNEDRPEDPPLRVIWRLGTSLDGWELGLLAYQLGRDDMASAMIVWGFNTNYRFGGVRAYSYWDAVDEEGMISPPIGLAGSCSFPSDVIETRSGGRTWTSEYVEVSGCGTFYEPRWADSTCHHVALRDGDQDPTTYGWLAGDYWLLPNMGFARMRLDALPGTWSLSDWEPAESWGEW